MGRARGSDGRLRIFVSSTMEDLVNEREAVCRRLREMNFEPVNAEAWTPSGQSSWARIQGKIESCDLFVLILGERYGWIPKDGPKSDKGQSVTELELREARDRGLPVLVFSKRLPASVDRTSKDALRRDAFRQEVLDWAGYFRGAEFDNCFQLADQLAAAVIELLSFEYQNLHARELSQPGPSQQPSQRGPSLQPSQPHEAKADVLEPVAGDDRGAHSSTPDVPELPSRLIHEIRGREALLLAGSGISLAAGFPSAAAFSASLTLLARRYDPSYGISASAAAFAGIAGDVESMSGRAALVDALRPLMEPSQGAIPTPAHGTALRYFSTIVTTNYDDLFERARQSATDSRPVLHGELSAPALPEPVLVKLHGSWNDPQTLVLSERDVIGFDLSRPKLWNALRELLGVRPVVVVGSSLRDPSLVRLHLEVGSKFRGYFVAPRLSPAFKERLREQNLTAIDATADTFFAALAARLDSVPLP